MTVKFIVYVLTVLTAKVLLIFSSTTTCAYDLDGQHNGYDKRYRTVNKGDKIQQGYKHYSDKEFEYNLWKIQTNQGCT